MTGTLGLARARRCPGMQLNIKQGEQPRWGVPVPMPAPGWAASPTHLTPPAIAAPSFGVCGWGAHAGSLPCTGPFSSSSFMISFSCKHRAGWYWGRDPRHCCPHPPGDAARGHFSTHRWVLWRRQVEEQLPWGLRGGFFPASFPNLAFPGKPPRAKPLPAPHTKRLLLRPRWRPCPSQPRPAGTHAGGEAVGRGGLVDLVGVGLGVGAVRRRLPLAPARGAAVHHAGLCRRLALLAGEGVALVRHHPGQRDKDMGRGTTTRLHPQNPLPKTPLSIPPGLAAHGPRLPKGQPWGQGAHGAPGAPIPGSPWVTPTLNPLIPPQHRGSLCPPHPVPSPLTLACGGTTRRRPADPRCSPAGCGCRRTGGFGATGRASCVPWSGWRCDPRRRLGASRESGSGGCSPSCPAPQPCGSRFSPCPQWPPHPGPAHLTRRGEGPGTGAVALVQGLVDHPRPLRSCIKVAGQHLVGVHVHLRRQS